MPYTTLPVCFGLKGRRDGRRFGAIEGVLAALAGQPYGPVLGQEVRAEDEGHGYPLRDYRLPVWEDREPQARPVRYPLKPRDLRRAYPARKLHLVDLFTDHYEEHHSQHYACYSEHLLVGQLVVAHEVEHGHNRREDQAE